MELECTSAGCPGGDGSRRVDTSPEFVNLPGHKLHGYYQVPQLGCIACASAANVSEISKLNVQDSGNWRLASVGAAATYGCISAKHFHERVASTVKTRLAGSKCSDDVIHSMAAVNSVIQDFLDPNKQLNVEKTKSQVDADREATLKVLNDWKKSNKLDKKERPVLFRGPRQGELSTWSMKCSGCNALQDTGLQYIDDVVLEYPRSRFSASNLLFVHEPRPDVSSKRRTFCHHIDGEEYFEIPGRLVGSSLRICRTCRKKPYFHLVAGDNAPESIKDAITGSRVQGFMKRIVELLEMERALAESAGNS